MYRDPRICKHIPKVTEAGFYVHLTPKPMPLISMLDPPGGEAVLEVPGIHKREDHGLRASGAPEREGMQEAGEQCWASKLAVSESRGRVDREAGWDSGMDSSPSKGW